MDINWEGPEGFHSLYRNWERDMNTQTFRETRGRDRLWGPQAEIVPVQSVEGSGSLQVYFFFG